MHEPLRSACHSAALGLPLLPAMQGNWYTWLSLLLFLVFAGFWMSRYSKAMKLFPVLIIMPIIQASARSESKHGSACLAAGRLRGQCVPPVRRAGQQHGVHPPWSASVKSPLADALASFPFITILQIVWILFSMISGSIYFQVRTTRSHSFSHCCSLHAGTAAPVALLRACMHCHLPPPPAAWAA